MNKFMKNCYICDRNYHDWNLCKKHERELADSVMQEFKEDKLK